MWNSTNTRGIQKLLFHHCAPVLCQALTHLVCLLACLLKMLPFLSESPWWSPGTRLASCWSLWATETNNGTSWRTSPSGTCRTASCPLSCRRTLTSVYQTSHSSHSVSQREISADKQVFIASQWHGWVQTKQRQILSVQVLIWYAL